MNQSYNICSVGAMAQRNKMDIVGNNIANVNTDIIDFDYAKVLLWEYNTLKPLTTPEIFYKDDIEIN